MEEMPHYSKADKKFCVTIPYHSSVLTFFVQGCW